MKRFIITIALACVAVFSFAQSSPLLRPRVEIAEISSEENNTQLEVFYMNDVEPRMYWLSVGNLGVGTDLLQVNFDPVFELFIPLGENLDEVVARMEEIKALFKMQKGESTEIQGCFAVAYPNDNLENVTVTYRKGIAARMLEFSIPTASDGIVRATYIHKMDFGSILSGVKFYRKLHPNQ